MGTKVFTDTDSQFLARVFQPTASNLLMEPRQTTASNLQTTVNQTVATNLQTLAKQTVATNLQTTANQTTATNLQTTANQTTASNLQALVFQTTASNFNTTVEQSTASLLQTTVGNRGTRDVASTNVGFTTTAFNALPQQNVITLSKFSVLVKGGTASSEVRLQLSPIGGTASTNWVNDSTVVNTISQSAVTILTPTRFAKYLRLQYRKPAAGTSALVNIWYQGFV